VTGEGDRPTAIPFLSSSDTTRQFKANRAATQPRRKRVYSLWMLVKPNLTVVGTAIALSGPQITVDR
jgi:hypothetical protein